MRKSPMKINVTICCKTGAFAFKLVGNKNNGGISVLYCTVIRKKSLPTPLTLLRCSANHSELLRQTETKISLYVTQWGFWKILRIVLEYEIKYCFLTLYSTSYCMFEHNYYIVKVSLHGYRVSVRFSLFGLSRLETKENGRTLFLVSVWNAVIRVCYLNLSFLFMQCT